jgi:acetylglutamate kinase
VHDNIEGNLGYVGYLTGANSKLLNTFWKEGIVPVAACLGLGSDGELYNINADHMAAACAEYLQADHLTYLTDVQGVLDGDKILPAIACDEIGGLVQRKIVSGGMVLKLEAAKRAIEGGVHAVHIVGGTIRDGLLAAVHAAESSAPVFRGEIPGTRVMREPIPVAASAAFSVA